MRHPFITKPFNCFHTAPQKIGGESKNVVCRAEINVEQERVTVFTINELSPESVVNTLVGHVCAAAISAERESIETPRFFVRLDEAQQICGFATEAVTFGSDQIAEHSSDRSLSASPSPSSSLSGASSLSHSARSDSTLDSTGSSPSPRLFSLPATFNTQCLINAGLGFASGIRISLRDTDGGGNLLFSDDYCRIAQIDFEHTNGIKRKDERHDLLNFSSQRLKRLAFLLASPFMLSDAAQDDFNWMCHQGIDQFDQHMITLLKDNPQILKDYLADYLRGLKAGIEFFAQKNIADLVAKSVGLSDYLAQPQHAALRQHLEKTINDLQQHNRDIASLLDTFPSDDETQATLSSHIQDRLATTPLKNRWKGRVERGQPKDLTAEEQAAFHESFNAVIMPTAGHILNPRVFARGDRMQLLHI